MTTHRHKDSLKKWTTSVTDPDLSPYAKQVDLDALAARVAALEGVEPPVDPPPVEPPPVEPPPVEPPAATGTLYGSGVGMDTLANTTLGGSGPIKSFMRFRSPFTSLLRGFRVYMLNQQSPSGYGGGTGGKARFTLQTDAGGYPSGNVLAEVTVTPQNTGGVAFAFPSPPALTAGALYHLVCENVDPNQGANYFALDYAWSISHGTQWHPRFLNTDWAHGYWDDRAWVTRTAYAPILDLDFAAGHHGMGYMEVSLSYPGEINGTAKVRERFTVTGGTRTITSVGVRLVRGSGSADLVLTLRDSGGSAIATANIAAGDIEVGTPGSGEGDEAIYASAAMSATLTNGASYTLELSTTAGTVYYAWAIRKGTSYGYDPATYFNDGYAEKSANGSTWTSLGRVANQNDLQFYFGTA